MWINEKWKHAVEKAITPMQSFAELLQTKIRDDIAGMLPDEVIAEMVKKATDNLFFAKQTETIPGRSSWENKIVEKPSKFEEMVLAETSKIIQAEAEKALKAWSQDNPDRIANIVQETIEAGLASMVMKALNQSLHGLFMDGTSMIVHNLRQSLKTGGY